MKIQLDAEAINAIMASRGEECKLELQQAVVNEFAKKYLKGVVAQEQINGLEKSIKDYISENFGKRKSSYSYEIELNQGTKDAIQKYATDNIDRFIRKAIREDENITALIETSIAKAFDNLDFQAYIQKVYDKKMSEDINSQIQEKIRTMLANVNLASFLKG